MASETNEHKKKTKINLGLILRHHFGSEALHWDHHEQVEKLNNITHLRLDRLNIGWIDGLELVATNLTNLYLQCNKIECIENLEFLPNLKFLTLAHNFITDVEGLVTLPKLGFLDISNNFIENLNVDELPKSVVFLNLSENMCTNLPEYKKSVINALPQLKQLDSEFIGAADDSDDTDDDEEEYEYVDSDEATASADVDDQTEELAPIRRNLEDMLLSSQQRTEEYYREHKHTVKLLGEYRENVTQIVPD